MVIRDYIRYQEREDKRLDQLNVFQSTTHRFERST